MPITTNKMSVIVKLDRWKVVKIPEDIQFDYFEFDGLNWWWNEEKKLLIDHYNIMRKTDKDSFLYFYQRYPMIYHRKSQKIQYFITTLDISKLNIDTFGNWDAATKVH